MSMLVLVLVLLLLLGFPELIITLVLVSVFGRVVGFKVRVTLGKRSAPGCIITLGLGLGSWLVIEFRF